METLELGKDDYGLMKEDVDVAEDTSIAITKESGGENVELLSENSTMFEKL